ncbi:hypothetical protein [Actinomadura sp. WAC 06369]|uniref:hypothetical protein n=1 Tax=Actinomadura sp. WAC 06369 TaxID=2203193 RepID=UPI000F784767|nr:hypothetical protein [Actinomadura sp. WAC 06369]RSN71346.1 hypothetical protein DMH08_02790 [Actinomadura sp. WAC 06369]
MTDPRHATAPRRKTSHTEGALTVNLPGLVAVTLDASTRTITVDQAPAAGDTPRHMTDDMRGWKVTDRRPKKTRA